MSFKSKVSDWLNSLDDNTVNNFFESEEVVKFEKWDNDLDRANKLKVQDFLATDVELKHEDKFGGEDEGNDYWSIYSFKDNSTGETLYVKFDGWYQSYNGSTFSGWYFVTPRKVEITRYEKVDHAN